MDFIFAHFVCKGSFGQSRVEITNDPLDLKISILVLVSQIMVFILNISFVHFEYKKDFWHILLKFTVYRVFLLCLARLFIVSNKKQFQLVDITIERL